jgi:rhodanese-related sulfurtransferase
MCFWQPATAETQIMAYRGTGEQVAGVAEYLSKHGFGVAWERQT